MAHNNSTPGSIITAPTVTVRPVVSHVLEKDEETDTVQRTTTVAANQGEIDQVTGVYTNPARKVRKAAAASKRARRNKGGRKQKG
jgi:hypothetical protein